MGVFRLLRYREPNRADGSARTLTLGLVLVGLAEDMLHSYELASAYVAALTYGCPDDVIDWRFIHDTDKGVPGIKRRGRLADIWNEACRWNAAGYGIFACINAMDGVGNELANVAFIRTHIVDLDNLLTAAASYERAASSHPAPAFAVQSSAGKYHVYWRMQPYKSNDFYDQHQRKLRQIYDGDKSVVDPTRVLRVPGFFNHKYSTPGGDKHIPGAVPHLVTCWSLSGYGSLIPAETLAAALAPVNVIDGGSGSRHPLGEPSLAAPSLDWARYALATNDPNEMARNDWIAFTAAWKQACWTLADPDTLFSVWSEWCGRYSQNDAAENLKQWNSIRTTEVGWNYVVNRSPAVKAQRMFGGVQHTAPAQTEPVEQPAMAMPPSAALDCSGEILTDHECREWFKGCVYVETFGEMLIPSGRFLGVTKFNSSFGGKKFLIDSTGKVTDEAWKAATRSTLWNVPHADHIRFLPHAAHLDIVQDELGRKGVNTYRPANIAVQPGDISPFMRHIAHVLPVENDRYEFLRYLAHNAKYPGHKIPWAPLIQSAEGVGKGVFKRLITHMCGAPYVYFPSARDMVESGSKFNAWMRNRLFILVDEIKVDERRDMVEVLKPMISENRIEVQGKGKDQDIEDNYSNWAFFSNHKGAIPVDQNGRRFAVFYSAIQSEADLIKLGMNQAYFDDLYDWLDNRHGLAMVTHWLRSWDIERGAVPMRAPKTSSTDEAQRISRSPHETAILNAITDGVQGFRGGWIGSVAAAKRFKALGLRLPGEQSLTAIVERLGYHHIGRAGRAFVTEDPEARSELFAVQPGVSIAGYGAAQGYE